MRWVPVMLAHMCRPKKAARRSIAAASAEPAGYRRQSWRRAERCRAVQVTVGVPSGEVVGQAGRLPGGAGPDPAGNQQLG
jgi:hypothetical protein